MNLTKFIRIKKSPFLFLLIFFIAISCNENTNTLKEREQSPSKVIPHKIKETKKEKEIKDTFYKNGKLKKRIKYRKGKKSSETVFNNKGDIIELISWHRNGNKKLHIIENSNKTTKITSWYRNKQLESEIYKEYLFWLRKNLNNTKPWSEEFSKYKQNSISQIKNLLSDNDFFSKYEEKFKIFYKQQNWESLKEDFWNFTKNIDIKNFLKYNIFFEENISIFNKLSFSGQNELEKKLKSNQTSKKEKSEIKRYLSIIELKNIPNSRSKETFIDVEELKYNNEINPKNIECFCEKDIEWNKSYFTFNDILNDSECFWLEIWRIKIENKSIKILSNFIKSPDRKIKHAISKNILLEKRNFQEILMYNFKDRRLEEKNEIDEKNWFWAEKITEWFFRYFSQKYCDINLKEINEKQVDFYKKLKELEIKIIQASVWEDEKEKNDLFIQIKDKKKWIKIQKELQLTVNHNPEILAKKRMQIHQRKEKEELLWNNIDIELLELQNLDFARALKIWRISNRPVWWLKHIFSFNDKEYLRITLERILKDMIKKI